MPNEPVRKNEPRPSWTKNHGAVGPQCGPQLSVSVVVSSGNTSGTFTSTRKGRTKSEVSARAGLEVIQVGVSCVRR
jgi:hypothetical protein